MTGLTMRAVRCHEWKPYPELEIEDVAVPSAGAGQVRIAVHYAGMSFATSLVTEGKYQRKPPRPFTPGSEVAGVIEEVGADVPDFKVGDRVCAGLDWGGHAEQAVIDAATVYRIPDALPFDIAPQFPLSYATSYAALFWRAAVQPGETVLVHGSAGAVGLAAVELVKAIGGRVIATASSEERLAFARRHGADEVVLYPSENALEQIRALVPGGVDVVFDPIGGDAFDLSLRCVANSGRILVIGFAGGRVQQIPANHLLVKDVAVFGFNYGNFIGWGRTDERRKHEPRVRTAMRQMFAWYEGGLLKPETSHRFPLTEYREAFAAVMQRRSMGKVVLAMPVTSGSQGNGTRS